MLLDPLRTQAVVLEAALARRELFDPRFSQRREVQLVPSLLAR